MHPSRRADLALLVVTAVWGLTFPSTRALLGAGNTLFALLAARFALAALVLTPIARRDIAALDRQTLRAGLLLGALLSAGFVGQTLGLEESSSASTAFITASSVVMVPFVDRALRGVPVEPRALLGAVLAFAGLAIIAGPEALVGLGRWGDLWTLSSAVIWAFYLVLLQQQILRVQHRGLLWLQLCFAALALGGVAALGAPRILLDVPTLAGLGFLAVVVSVGTSLLQYRFQRATTPARAAVIYTLESLFATAFAAAFFGEAISPRTLLGGAAVIAGVLLTEVGITRRSAHAAAAEAKTRT